MLDNKGFDLWANGYDKSVNLCEQDNDYPFAGYKDILNTIYNQIRVKNEAKILDIGFGTGILTKRLYDDGYEIWGIDFSEKMIEISRKKMPEAKLIQYDFVKGLPEEVESQKFDFIISTYALHHLNDSEKVKFLTNILNLLNKDGIILIGDVAFETRKMHNKCKADCGEDGWDDDEFYIIFNELKDSFEIAEFTQISHCAGVLELSNKNIIKSIDRGLKIT
jgi:putative AdoMet-dependent methyltransferase